MSYDRTEIHIALHCLQSGWMWSLIDGQGDLLASGRQYDAIVATREAIDAFDSAVAGTLRVKP